MGRVPCCQKDEGLKKGPWTPEEDQKLISFIDKHGHENWRALPKRCGERAIIISHHILLLLLLSLDIFLCCVCFVGTESTWDIHQCCSLLRVQRMISSSSCCYVYYRSRRDVSSYYIYDPPPPNPSHSCTFYIFSWYNKYIRGYAPFFELVFKDSGHIKCSTISRVQS